MAKRKGITGRGVTANMLDLGSSDSGFESQRPDKIDLFLPILNVLGHSKLLVSTKTFRD